MAESVQHHLTIPQYVADYELGGLTAEELIVDVLTNLRHFADAQDVSFVAALLQSEGHYTVERVEALRALSGEAVAGAGEEAG